jgi:hypothetical protein
VEQSEKRVWLVVCGCNAVGSMAISFARQCPCECLLVLLPVIALQSAVFDLDPACTPHAHDPRGHFAFSPPDMLHSVLLGTCVSAVDLVIAAIADSWPMAKQGEAAQALLELRMAAMPPWLSRALTTYRRFLPGTAGSALSAQHRAGDFGQLVPLLIFGIGFDTAVISNKASRLRVQRMLLALADVLLRLSATSYTEAELMALGSARCVCVRRNMACVLYIYIHISLAAPMHSCIPFIGLCSTFVHSPSRCCRAATAMHNLLVTFNKTTTLNSVKWHYFASSHIENIVRRLGPTCEFDLQLTERSHGGMKQAYRHTPRREAHRWLLRNVSIHVAVLWKLVACFLLPRCGPAWRAQGPPLCHQYLCVLLLIPFQRRWSSTSSSRSAFPTSLTAWTLPLLARRCS